MESDYILAANYTVMGGTRHGNSNSAQQLLIEIVGSNLYETRVWFACGNHRLVCCYLCIEDLLLILKIKRFC